MQRWQQFSFGPNLWPGQQLFGCSPEILSCRSFCSEKQTQGATLRAIAMQCSVVSVMLLSRQQVGISVIFCFPEPHPGFAKTIFRHKGVPCVLSGFGLCAQTVWNSVGRMPVSQGPDWDHSVISHSEESSCQTVTAFIHRPFPSVICTLLSFLPLFSCAAYLLLDVLSSFCMQIWSRLSIRNQYLKWCFPHKIIIIVKSKYFADLESSKNILCTSWQESIIKLSSNCFYCGKVRMLDYMCQHVKIKTV